MKATVPQDLKSIYQISRSVYQEQPLLKRYVWRQVKFDVLALLALIVYSGSFGILISLIPSELVQNILGGILALSFFYWATVFSRTNYARMLVTADAALRGEQLTHTDVVAMVSKRRGLIAKWVALDLAVFAALTWLQELDNKIPFLGTILAIVGSLTWQTVSFFSLPIIVLHGETPLAAVKESASAVKETWKTGKLRYGTGGMLQAALGYFAISMILIAWLGIIMGVAALWFSTFSNDLVLSDTAKRLFITGVAIIAVPLLGFITYFNRVVQAHYAVWQVALYRFAVHHDYVGIFPREILEKAVVPVEKRGLGKLFGRKTA
jgi:hypothetical protein